MHIRDFTYSAYRELLLELHCKDYSIIPFVQFVNNEDHYNNKIIILRHDVDRIPKNSLIIAEIEKELGINASYYFRIVKDSYNKKIIGEIANLGHEIGYHYEDMVLAKGDFEKAIDSFERNLDKLRQFYPVKTICMHGSPLSKWDNRLIWQRYNYRDFGILAEPYYDIDYNKILYLTDTGRRWNGAPMSIRDKVTSSYNIGFRTTYEIIKAVKEDKLPSKMMINTHPQRWNDKFVYWTRELIGQNTKNIIKRTIVKKANEYKICD